jgi:NADH-quinone oxidoreductase subunit C/D
VLRFLRQLPQPYVMLYDLHGGRRAAAHAAARACRADFSVFYHLLSLERNSDVRIKVALSQDDLRLPSAGRSGPMPTGTSARCGISTASSFERPPHLQRIMMPRTWSGHPLRKDYPARATEFDPFMLDAAKQDLEQESLRFVP